MLEWHEIALRLLSAAILGGVIGFERERKDWAAGTRTHMMACMGSSLVMIVSCFGFSDILGYPNVSLDPLRVASSVIIGIGYLGAGIILVLKRGNIRGLTIASALWATAAVGLSVGGGMYFTGACATVIAITILYVVQLIQKKATAGGKKQELVAVLQKQGNGAEIIKKMISYGSRFSSATLEYKKKKYRIRAILLLSQAELLELLSELKLSAAVQKIKLKKN